MIIDIQTHVRCGPAKKNRCGPPIKHGTRLGPHPYTEGSIYFVHVRKKSYKSASWQCQPRQEAFSSDLRIVGNQIQANETGAGVKEEVVVEEKEISSNMKPSAH